MYNSALIGSVYIIKVYAQQNISIEFKSASNVT